MKLGNLKNWKSYFRVKLFLEESLAQALIHLDRDKENSA